MIKSSEVSDLNHSAKGRQINFCLFFYNLNLVSFWTFLHLESDLPVGGIVFHKHIF